MVNSDTSFEMTWLEEVDSTSRVARDYLNAPDNHKPVHAFAARRQVAGVGRQGRKWESSAGNLHLSIAFPRDFVPPHLRDILPLAVGVAAVKWLERAASVRAVLKWPNDIVLDCSKIGGILCEATVSGMTWTGAVVGIGINLTTAPPLEDNSEYSATSILAATGVRLMPRLACDALTRQIVYTVTQSLREVVMMDYRNFATAPGQIWRAKTDKSFLQQEAFDASGNLRLRSLLSHEVLVLNSSEHQYGWTAMEANANSLLVADIGNSRIKLGLCGKESQKLAISNTVAWTPQSEDGRELVQFARCAVNDGVPPVIHASSVNSDNFLRLKNLVEPYNILVREIRRTAVRSIASKYDANNMGMDRLAGVEAALALKAWGIVSGPLVVVSLGTATTIDLIDGAGIHWGGLIGVGMGLATTALNKGTSVLPLVNTSEQKLQDWSSIPTTTQTAIASAAVRMTAGWIDREVEEWAKYLGLETNDCQLLLTGGYAGDIVPYLSASSQAILYRAPSLNLLGVGVLVTSAG